jgi:hypothetical protein
MTVGGARDWLAGEARRHRFSDALPKARSGKIIRRLKEIAAGGEVKDDATTFEDLSVIARLPTHGG